jgi:DNA polymerase I-like protein with 3'-5' exonuclease and polymerase domains
MGGIQVRRPKHLFVVRGPDGVDDVLARLQDGPLAVDTETTGLNWRTDRVGGVCLAAGDTAIFAYRGGLNPVMHWLARQVRRSRELVFHHAKFDLHMLYGTFGLHIAYPVHDTMIQSRLLDNRGALGNFSYGAHGGHSLKRLAKVFVDPFAEDAEKDLMRDIRAKGGRHKGDWMLASERFFAKYSALDPWYTLQLHTQFLSRIRNWSQPDGYPSLRSLYENERWLTLALRDMERRGITIDRDFLEQWEQELQIDAAKALRRLNKIAGRDDINWNSTPQLRRLLFASRRDGGLDLNTDRRTKKGEVSTDKTTLTRLAHPIGVALLRYRRVSKQHGTFALGLLNKATADDTVHCHFNQNVDTGRMSCSDPNLQQQDRNSGVRRGFIPRRGMVLRYADYSQIEMRIAAHVADEQTLINGFNSSDDFDTHAATASIMFGVKTPTSEQRGRGKTMNFATIYGAGLDNITESLMNQLSYREAIASCREMHYTPAPGESPHRALAELLRGVYDRAMPRMRQSTREMEQSARRWGFAMNDYGRHRYLRDEEAYKAFNTRVQGSAADCGKVGLVHMYRELQLGTGELAMLLQVHDEVVYETEGDPRTDQRVLECLNDYTTFKVPITAEISGSATSWQDKSSISFD